MQLIRELLQTFLDYSCTTQSFKSYLKCFFFFSLHFAAVIVPARVLSEDVNEDQWPREEDGRVDSWDEVHRFSSSQCLQWFPHVGEYTIHRKCTYYEIMGAFILTLHCPFPLFTSFWTCAHTFVMVLNWSVWLIDKLRCNPIQWHCILVDLFFKLYFFVQNGVSPFLTISVVCQFDKRGCGNGWPFD